ncbi:MAG: thioesterase family protein [Betaproteobacteria bacterium]|nr:MAG: thioesterase family protein [Betaproteobacteria bacterium]
MDARQRKLDKLIRAVFEERVPFNRLLGLKMVSIDPKAPRCRFEMREELIGNPTRGILHGGVISAVLDVIAGFSIHLALLDQHGAKEEIHFPNIGTIDLHVDYLRPGRGKWFDATARVVRMGSRIAVTHMELRNDADVLIATGSAAYVVG